jgi:hypothetical protein
MLLEFCDSDMHNSSFKAYFVWLHFYSPFHAETIWSYSMQFSAAHAPFYVIRFCSNSALLF